MVRKGFLVAGTCGALLLFPAVVVRDPTLSIVLLTGACLMFGLFTSNLWAVTQTLAGASAAGKWTGIQNTFGNLSGIIAPWATGWILAETGSFLWAFGAACGALALSAASFLVLVRKVAPIQWRN